MAARLQLSDRDESSGDLIGAMRSELRTLDGEVAALDVKSGFCPGDRYPTTPTEHRERRYVTNCGTRQPELTTLRMGISPVSATGTTRFLSGQQIDIHDLPPEEYRLVHGANPDGALEESDTSNNESSLMVRIATRRDATGPRPSHRADHRPGSRGRCAWILDLRPTCVAVFA